MHLFQNESGAIGTTSSIQQNLSRETQDQPSNLSGF
jgi:hypothetical protein